MKPLKNFYLKFSVVIDNSLVNCLNLYFRLRYGYCNIFEISSIAFTRFYVNFKYCSEVIRIKESDIVFNIFAMKKKNF